MDETNTIDKLNDISSLYQWRSMEARKLGLAQKEWEFGQISSAVGREANRLEYGRTMLDIRAILNWKPYYEVLKYEWPKFSRRIYEGNFLNAFWNWITDRWHWQSRVSPSFPAFFKDIWKNVKIFIFWNLSPWLHTRYKFLESFVNLNGCKLLDNDINWVYVRNRDIDCAYYTLRFSGFRYRLIKTQILKDGEERGQNGFMTGIMLALNEKAETEADKYRQVNTPICSGWVFGWKSFVREFDKIIALTPDLEWFKEF